MAIAVVIAIIAMNTGQTIIFLKMAFLNIFCIAIQRIINMEKRVKTGGGE
jgi:hypothetical protein